ncbi:serine hydroxymethyltransferase [Buchnera aphidicola (Formosaphis micheliae)]|uniref:serine hydroxymethyltransferase n=1 Tax=Buchnera aphidicola TaxID=9 RepID=UPI0031CC3D17
MFNNILNVKQYDNEIWNIINQEKIRQQNHLELIASENYVSDQVMSAQGSQLTNKYAEGYPQKRYYGGCEYVDNIETIAINRAKKLFNVNYANVQPHSGSQANFAVYNALLNPGDLILGMKLSHGGHLTHGANINFSGKIYKSITYGVDDNGIIDYKNIEKLAKLYNPKIIVGGFSAYSGLCDWERMRYIADSINAFFLVDIAHVAGLVATGLYPDPLSFAHVVTSTTHKTLAGPRGGLILIRHDNKDLFRKIDASVFPGVQGGPLMHVIAAKAIAFKEAMEPNFKKYQIQVLRNAQCMVNVFISSKYKVLSNGTHNHLFLLDLTDKNITGKDAEIALGKVNITVNKNSIPYDTKNPFITSGIRIGTPAITRRGLQEKEVISVSHFIIDVLNKINSQENMNYIKNNVIKLCKKFPVYL